MTPAETEALALIKTLGLNKEAVAQLYIDSLALAWPRGSKEPYSSEALHHQVLLTLRKQLEDRKAPVVRELDEPDLGDIVYRAVQADNMSRLMWDTCRHGKGANTCCAKQRSRGHASNWDPQELCSLCTAAWHAEMAAYILSAVVTRKRSEAEKT